MKAPSYFFKFIPPASNSHLQSIPKSFEKYITYTRKNKVAILRRGNRKWAVKMGEDLVFGEGWNDFMTANGVQDFDIVVFKHQGNMVFDTMVFDNTWCERQHSNYNYRVTRSIKTMILDQTHHPYFDGTLKQRDTGFVMSIPKKFALANGLSGGEMVFMNVDNEGSWTVKLRNEFGKHFCIQRGLREFCTGIGLQKGESFRFELIHNGKKPAAVVSRLPNAGLVNPHFRSTFTVIIIKNGYLNIPLAFARSNKLNMRNCEVCLKDENQRLWPAQLCDSGGHVRIFGLRGMMIANELKEGDDFILELLDNGDKPFMNFHRNGNEVATNAFV